MKARILTAAACLCAFGAPATALAALGGTVDSIRSNQAKMRATARPAAARDNYTVHESRTPAGTVVREYAAGGKVFAVSWNGPVKPDIRGLLGNYFEEYSQGLAEQRGGRRQARVERKGLVVRSGGHMRAFSGMAYLPDALPPGFTPEDIE